MTQYGFYVNTDICIGCKACMTSCFDRNDLEAPEKFRKVWEFGGGEWVKDDAGAFTQAAFAYYVSMTCGQCEDPACVKHCPTGAMQKDAETGIVNNDKSICIGCMTCEKLCPYNHPVKLADGLSHKCVMCTDRGEDGAPGDAAPDPVCARACPVRAIEFGLIEDLRAAHETLDTLGTLSNETKPNVVFTAHRDAEREGDIMNPLELVH